MAFVYHYYYCYLIDILHINPSFYSFPSSCSLPHPTPSAASLIHSSERIKFP